MHLLLTDRLTCPRCGPAFGLILLAERMDERRVLEGALGCANCRERYPVREGFGDLRPAPRAELGAGDVDAVPRPETEPAALAELLGAAAGGGATLALGAAAVLAPRLAAVTDDDLEVVALDPGTRTWSESPGVSRLTSAPGLPFFDGIVRGVLAHGSDDLARVLPEAVRVLAPRHRVVVMAPAADTPDRLRAAGLAHVVEGPGVVAGAR